MPRLKLTEKSIARLPAPDPSGKQVPYWDQDLKGFGVLVSGKTNGKSFIVQRDLPDGRTRRITIAACAEMSLKDAFKKAETKLVEMRQGIDPKAKRDIPTLRAALDDYARAHSRRLKPRSLKSYHDALAHLKSWFDRPLAEITRDEVEKRHGQIAAEIEEKRRQAAAAAAKTERMRAVRAEGAGWSEAAQRHRAAAAAAEKRVAANGQATANGVMRVLRLLWNHAADRNPALGRCPVRLKKQWFPVPRRERLVRDDDLAKFYAAVGQLENPVQRDYLLLLLFTGLRRVEAASLRWEDVDLKGKVLRIPAANTKAGRKLDLPLTDVVHDLLVARRRLGDTKFVFPANSKSGHLAEPKFALRQVAKACGVEISVHDLRRTFLTAAEAADISHFALKALVNHALGNDVTGGYVQMTVERLREPAQRVADRLKELCGIAPLAGESVVKFNLPDRR